MSRGAASDCCHAVSPAARRTAPLTPLTQPLRRFAVTIGLLVTLTTCGIVGFRLTETFGWGEATWMAVSTLTTLGAYDEPLSDAGKLFAVGYLFCGLGVASYSLFALGQTVVSGRFRSLWERRAMDARIEKMSGHNVVCGLGRMGQGVCEYLAARDRPFVIVDRDEDLLTDRCADANWTWVVGDAADDAVLKSAGVARAASLVTALPTDADNVYVVLSARGLSEELQIVARAAEERAVPKLERAGADRVVSPLASGAVKMARFMLNPHVEDFLAIADDRESDLELADVQIAAGSPLCGKALKETDLAKRGLMIVGIRRDGGDRLMPPPGDAVIEPGDCLFAFGKSAAINELTRRDGTEVEATGLATDDGGPGSE